MTAYIQINKFDHAAAMRFIPIKLKVRFRQLSIER